MAGTFVHNAAHKFAIIPITQARRLRCPAMTPFTATAARCSPRAARCCSGAALWPASAPAQTNGGAKLRIGVIGSGHIGGTIGGLWVKAGHPVLFSSRHPEELKDLVAGLGANAQAGTVDQAIAFGDVLFIAVPYGALPQIGQTYGAALKGKIMLDACNAVAARDGAIADEVERDGIGVTSQKYLPGTRLVRAFNTMSYMIFAREANRADPKLAVPIAGDDAEAVQIAAGLVRDAGFDPVVVGKLDGREPLSARRAGLRPAGERSRAQAEAVTGAMNGAVSGANAARARRNVRAAALVGAGGAGNPARARRGFWSFAYFFTLLAGYYVLRPLRDQMGIAGGVKNLPWLFTATFVTLLVAQPLYGALVAKLPRARFIPVVYHFFAANLAVFWLLADARDRHGDRRARVLRLGQRVQPVCGGGVLVVHGRPVHRRPGQAIVRLHRRRRHRRRAARSGHHDRAVGAAGSRSIC